MEINNVNLNKIYPVKSNFKEKSSGKNNYKGDKGNKMFNKMEKFEEKIQEIKQNNQCNHNFKGKNTTLKKAPKRILVQPDKTWYFCTVCCRTFEQTELNNQYN